MNRATPLLPLVLACLALALRATGQEPSSRPAPRAGEGGAEANPEHAEKPVRSFLARWAASMKDVSSLRVEFTQTKKLRFLRRPRVSQGVTLLKGHTVLMRVVGRDGRPELELLVRDDAVRLHYPKQRRLELYPLQSPRKGPRSPFVLFGGDLERLADDYRASLRHEGAFDVLTLLPRSEDDPLRKTTIRLRDFTVVSMEQTTRRGDVLRLEVRRFERNAPVAEDDLRLSLADDTEVVDLR